MAHGNTLAENARLFIALNIAMADAGIAAWDAKNHYDYVRPISAIRYMCDKGQSSNPSGPSYDPEGITLHPGYIEVITNETVQPGERHAHLARREVVHAGGVDRERLHAQTQELGEH